MRIATVLLRSFWEFSDYYAWGLVTANPLAVRALEAASRRPVRAAQIREHGPRVVTELAALVPYIPDHLVSDDEGRVQPNLDTEFFVSHDDLPRLRKQAAREDRPWNLGDLKEGHEWFACTFRHQEPFPLSRPQWEAILRSSEQAWIEAFERMTLDERHRWRAHTTAEIDWIAARLTRDLSTVSVIDVGCGDGRHTLELAERGATVTGVDISPALLERAITEPTSATFTTHDARQPLPGGPYDLALCLYDVLGSTPDPNDDDDILTNIGQALRPDGVVVVSVMNEVVALDSLPAAQRPTQYDDFVQALDHLPPSRTMQDSGAIFNPEYLVHFEGCFYRKEQFFSAGDRLPREVIVRDRRYSTESFRTLIDGIGLNVERLEPVQAGSWERQPPLAALDPRAKELLAICTLRATR